ncbi:hypothetical protein [Foetidibacter luteolus]|uniref:hypothetical protein n=1 Tax=Foetidibacter luteolus TaxID=2608880 RepID=UPI00129AD456|nr:hypothetical protein [Foetidibacter luteolus]
MKKLAVYILLTLTLGWVACSKDETNPTAPAPGVTGTWKYTGYSGGIAGRPFTEQDTVTYFIQFDQSRYTSIRNGIQGCGTYSFEKDSAGSEVRLGLLRLSGEAGAEDFDVYRRNDTLSLYPHNMADAFSYHFSYSLKQFDWCADDVK